MADDEIALYTGPLSTRDVLRVLRAIERGDVTLTVASGERPLEPEVPYRASNGWEFVVFNDCGGWDYIDRFKPPDGEWINAFDPQFYFVSMGYRPSPEARRERWHWSTALTGYLNG